MTEAPTPFTTAADHILNADDPVDLQTLIQAMEAIAAQPADFRPDAISTVMLAAAKVVGRFVMLRGAMVDEVLRMELDEAEPEGRA